MDIRAYIESGVIESYVLGLASNEDIAELERLRPLFPEIDESIKSFASDIESYAFANSEMPPAFIKDRIIKALAEEQIPTKTSHPQLNQEIESSSSNNVINIGFWKKLAAASVILFLVNCGISFYFYNRYTQKSDAYQALLQERNTLFADNKVYQTIQKELQNTTHMLTDPNMMVVKMKSVAGKKNNDATVFWDVKTKDVYIMGNAIPQPISGMQYQLWALVDGKPVDAGMIDPTCGGTCKMKNVQRAQAFAITLEKQGGSPSPDLSQLYVMGNI